MQLSRRAFIASLTGALIAPRLALPAPLPNSLPMVADELIAFREVTYYDPILVRSRVVLYGANARVALMRSEHLWSAVMVNRQLA